MSSTRVMTLAHYPSSHLLNLPFELISLIISNLASPSPSTSASLPSSSSPPTPPPSTTNDLISLSLSHHIFAILAAPYLLRNIRLTVSIRSSALTRLVRLATILRSVPGLERHVRYLNWILEEPLTAEDSLTLPGDLLERFRCLPDLESLEIHCGVPVSSYTFCESDFDNSRNDAWYWKPLYRPNYPSEGARAKHRPNSSTAVHAPTYSSLHKTPLSNPILNFHSLFSSYIPLTSATHIRPSLPKLTKLSLSGITSLPLTPIFQLPTLESLMLLKCSAILQYVYDGAESTLHPQIDMKLSNHALKHFKAVETSIYIGLDDKITPSLPWFLKGVETMWLEDFGYHEPDPMASDSDMHAGQPSETPFSYARLKKLTCAGIIDFHPLVGTGYNTNRNAEDVSPAPSPFPVLREFVFEQTSSYPTDHLCSLYPYFQNLEVLQIGTSFSPRTPPPVFTPPGLTSQPQLNTHPPLYQSNLVPILSRPESRLKSLIIRRYESTSDALETLQEFSDALSGSHLIDSPRIPTLQSIVIDLTLTSSNVRDLERLIDAWHRLSSVLLSKKTGGESMTTLKRIRVMVGLVWTPEIMTTQQERDGWKHVERHDSAVGWSDSWGSFMGWGDSGSDFGWGRDENDHEQEEYNQSDSSTSSYASSYAASYYSESQSSGSPLSTPSRCFPTHKNRTSPAFDSTTHIHAPHSIEWDETRTDDELKTLVERPLAELIARSRELGSEVEVSINVRVIRHEEGY